MLFCNPLNFPLASQGVLFQLLCCCPVEHMHILLPSTRAKEKEAPQLTAFACTLGPYVT